MATTAPPRVGFTATKKIGNAVVRNRVKRRLRETCPAQALAATAQPGHDYVLIGRAARPSHAPFPISRKISLPP